MTKIELTPAELKLIHNALKSFLFDFGHDEADILDEIHHLLAKLAVLDGVVVSAAGDTAGRPNVLR